MNLGLPTSDELAIAARLHHVVTQFCRGVDRRDAELIRACYYHDAHDDRGAFHGSPAELADWLIQRYAAGTFVQHSVSNFHILGILGDIASTETYWHARSIDVDGELSEAGGRYLDRFERRAGQWRIADRLCTTEWSTAGPSGERVPVSAAATDRSDPSYPLAALVTDDRTLSPADSSDAHVDGVVA